MPFVWGFVIAYLLNGPMMFCENKLLRFCDRKKPRPKLKRCVALAMAYILGLLVVSLVLVMLIPHLAENIVAFGGNFKAYMANLDNVIQNITNWNDFDGHLSEMLDSAVQSIVGLLSSFLDGIVPWVVDKTTQFTSGLINFFIGAVAGVYFLAGKETLIAQIKKILYAMFDETKTDKLLNISRLSHKTFTGFIFGKIIDSAIIGVLAFIGFSLLQLPYSLMLAVIIGVTNVIPFFGPFIGAIPCGFLILMADPVKVIWFAIFIFLLQQLDGNVIGPRILGDTTGLPAIWVMFSIILGGGLFGFAGMVLGVPVFSVSYSLFKAFLNRSLSKKELSTVTRDYYGENAYEKIRMAEAGKADDEGACAIADNTTQEASDNTSEKENGSDSSNLSN